MPLNTEKKNRDIFDYDEQEKFRIEEMFLNDSVVQVIKELMKLNNIKTKKELAEKTGVSPAYISKVFRSDKNFNVGFLVKIERVFNTTFTFSAKSLHKNIIDQFISNYNDIEGGGPKVEMSSNKSFTKANTLALSKSSW
jgi:transcriptional regulator with XRE-family HTH domain